ncbi:hypothetical protein [Paenibacillus thalictri]|uniref:Uncharacterized protein n=1 Tax=Paenibacillus thalictri TaxID=2527873 RepID=A0A4Q9DNG4_9BACL|nr:hypothetical protein [Paenibacillus thalictri]TBL75075.1 hypothetical protein EYB31_23990 [Paenibacillus thalictri]
MEDLLKQILAAMHGLKADMEEVRQDVSALKADMEEVKQDVSALKQDVSLLQDGQRRLEQKVDDIHQSVVRIEEGQPLDIYAMLQGVDRKLVNKDSEISVLNKRVFRVETELELMASKQ